MTLIINDDSKCPECSAYWQENGHCTNGHPKPEDWTELEIDCIECGKAILVAYRISDFISWYNIEKLIQDAFPYLTQAQREMFKTEVCGECWDRLFKPSDYETFCHTCIVDDENDCLRCKHNNGNKG